MSYQMSNDNSPGGDAAKKEGFQLGGGLIASVAGLAVLVVFMLQNRDDVTVDFLAWDWTWPLWLVVLVSAVVGAFIWLGFGIMRRHRRRKERREERRD